MNYLEELSILQQDKEDKRDLLNIDDENYDIEYDKIDLEFEEKEKELMLKHNLLFHYQIVGLLLKKYREIYVFDTEVDNVIYTEFNLPDETKKVVTLNPEEIKLIRSLLDKIELSKPLTFIESNDIWLDGFNNDFTIIKSDEIYKINCTNIWTWKGVEEAPASAKMLIDLLQEISTIINKHENIKLSIEL